MKKLFIIVFATLGMVACTNEEDEPINNQDPVEIKLSAGVLEVTTKAAVNKGDAFDAQILKSESTGSYSSALTQSASFSTDGSTTLSTPWFYSLDATKSSYLIGYSPKDEASKVEKADGIVTFQIDGTQDVMISDEVSGNRDNSTEALKLSFAHKLTQIQFKVALSANLSTVTDMTISSIKIKNVTPEVKLTLPTTVEFAGTAKDLDINEIYTTALNTTAQKSGYTMVPPAASYQIDIVTNKGTFNGVTIQPKTGGFLEGSAHIVTLTFDNKSISASGEAAEWVTGSEGNITI